MIETLLYGSLERSRREGMLSAQQIIERLGLAPLPVEGGFFKETYRSTISTAIYYLLTPSTCSLLHRLSGDEVYHFYLGDPVDLLLLHADGSSEQIVLGPEIGEDQRVQQLVRGGSWQGSRLRGGGRFALMGTTMAPPFDPKNFELGDRHDLTRRYPNQAELIAHLT
jgi:hypothetical protein